MTTLERSSAVPLLRTVTVSKAIDYCISRKFDAIRLETTDGLTAARSLYDRLGFKTVSEDQVELWAGRRALIRMEKPLRSAPAPDSD
jgi:ribosomal protein S18 acetylase RimI-like enzyme